MSAGTTSQPRVTERFSKSLGGSVKSIIAPKGRNYFLLEHKTNSKKFKVGKTTEFIGDYVEIGRGGSYAINFGEDCNTVSRPHAAIIRKGNGWVLKHLSKTNPTLINGKSVKDEWYLNNGDEIQFSVEGPKVSFLIPNNNSTSTLGMTVRIKAAMNEAVKPYKTAIGVMVVAFLLSVGGLGYFIKVQSDEFNKYINVAGQELANLRATIANDSMSIKKFTQLVRKQPKFIYVKPPSPPNIADVPTPPTLTDLYPNVYFVVSSKIVYKIKDIQKEVEFPAFGTGFLLNDGRFVTARHVVEPWYYARFEEDESKNENNLEAILNIIASNGGEVELYLTAYSPSGKTLSFRSSQFRVNRSNDITQKFTTEEGSQYLLTKASLDNGSDWAFTQTNSSGILTYDSNLSNSLTASTTLYVLGYPFGKGANSKYDIKPSYGECKVARDGLDKGVIDISSRPFDQGNSGGPVFAKVNDLYVVVGIVSAYQGNQGTIVPISSITR